MHRNLTLLLESYFELENKLYKFDVEDQKIPLTIESTDLTRRKQLVSQRLLRSLPVAWDTSKVWRALKGLTA